MNCILNIITSCISGFVKVGGDLIAKQHYESPAIKRLLDDLNKNWDALCTAADAKGERLEQAAQQKALNSAFDDMHLRLDEIENVLKSQDLGLSFFHKVAVFFLINRRT